jgi:hypothetical protein
VFVLGTRVAGERAIPLEIDGGRDVELVRDATGQLRGRLVRERWRISGVVRVSAEALPGSVVKLRVWVENLGLVDVDDADRGRAMRRSLVGAHTLLAVRDGAFVSLLDPPQWAQAAADACANLHTWPVLVGEAGSRDVVLALPIILYDYPQVAPESPGDLCDATEIDEILTLRIMTLTEEEKREARGTDARARRIIERSDAIPPEVFERLHGAIRHLDRPRAAPDDAAERAKWAFSLDPQAEVSPGEAWVSVGRVRVTRGARVRLRPRRRADSMDAFLEGRIARVEGVYRDVDDAAYVAVVPEDDPGADLHTWYGRFLYFYPDEIEPLESGLAGGH